MANYKVHENPVRDEWLDKINQLKSVKEATQFLQDFRMKYTTPWRDSYDLELDYNFIEAKAEERLSTLKVEESKSGDDLLTKCTTGENAEQVAEDYWISKMDKADDKWKAEKIMAEFRQKYRPPVMPVNFFLETETKLGSRLMELRSENYYDTTLDELRKKRGVKVIRADELSDRYMQ